LWILVHEAPKTSFSLTNIQNSTLLLNKGFQKVTEIWGFSYHFLDEFEGKMKEIEIHKVKVNQALQEYKAKENPEFPLEMPLKASDIDLRPYVSPFIHRTETYRKEFFWIKMFNCEG